jgi:hypoxanthine phosphoribosyltransferase
MMCAEQTLIAGWKGRSKVGQVPDHEIEESLFTEEQIQVRVGELAREITRDYRDKTPLLLIGILKGAFIFLADLARRIELPVEFDFMAVSSYGSSRKTSGIVRIHKDLSAEISGKHLLIVEDIIDTGLTLSYLQRHLSARGAASVEICALLNKRAANQIDIPVRYEGFSIPDVFVVGYGLDYDQRYRNLPYIARLKK